MVKMEETFFSTKTHLFYMNEALKEAQKALSHDEVPVGAIVVASDGTIIGRGFNQVESKKTQTAHAESIALQQAAHAIGDWRLDGCVLYVTLEPCIMCIGLISLSRITHLVYGAKSPLFGYQSFGHLNASLDNGRCSSVYKNDMVVDGEVGAVQSQQLLKQFFQMKRKKKGEYQKAEFQGNQGCLD